MKYSHYMERFMKHVEWQVYLKENGVDEENRKETYGFPSQKSPPWKDGIISPLLKPFRDAVAKLAGSIKYRPQKNNAFQQQLRKVVSSIERNPNMLVASDKTSNFYEMKPGDYEKMVRDNVTTKYSKCDDNEPFNEVNREDRKVAKDLKIDDRVFVTQKREAVIFLKDHKQNFRNNPKCRVINPTKQELGKVSKQILEKVVEKIRDVSNLNHWKNTTSVLQWFTEIEGKHRYKFITWDICDFYASITEKLLGEALDWAEGFVNITPKQRDIIFHVRKSFLFHKGEAWVKTTNPDFDIPMGSYDSAEVTDLVGLYLLDQMRNQNWRITPGGYRDDFAAYTDLTNKRADKIKDDIIEFFDRFGLKIEITACNARVIDFLDVTLDLMTGSYKPYHKPNASLLYVHAQSNHPKSIIKNIPISVNRRLNILSSSEEMFDSVKDEYQEALVKAGHTHVLKYEKVNLKDLNKKKRKRQRYKHMFYFHPPHEDTVATKIGKRQLEILDRTIPPEHELHPLLNRHNAL